MPNSKNPATALDEEKAHQDDELFGNVQTDRDDLPVLLMQVTDDGENALLYSLRMNQGAVPSLLAAIAKMNIFAQEKIVSQFYVPSNKIRIALYNEHLDKIFEAIGSISIA